MKRVLGIGGVIAIALAAVASASAITAEKAARGPDRDRGARMAERLGLSEEQQERDHRLILRARSANARRNGTP